MTTAPKTVKMAMAPNSSPRVEDGVVGLAMRWDSAAVFLGLPRRLASSDGWCGKQSGHQGA